MAGCVPGRRHDMDRVGAEGDRVTVIIGLVDPRNVVALGCRTIDRHAIALLEPEIAGDMIAMVMGNQQHGRLPAGPLDGRRNRLFFGRIDDQRLLAVGIMHEHAVIIAAADELFDRKRHGVFPSFAAEHMALGMCFQRLVELSAHGI